MTVSGASHMTAAAKTVNTGASVVLLACLITTPSNGWRPGWSGRLDVIRFRNRVEKPRAVALELHRSDTTYTLKRAEGTGAPDGELSEGPIREYNIGRYVFLAGDRCAH